MRSNVTASVVVIAGSARRVGLWVANGTVTAQVAPLTKKLVAVVPVIDELADVAYDDPNRMLIARPTPGLMRPSLGFLVEDNRVTVVAQARRWKAPAQWLVLQRGVGAIDVGMPPAVAADLVQCAPAPDASKLAAALAAWDDADGPTPAALTQTLMNALGIPDADRLSRGELPAAGQTVQPRPRAVRRFERNIQIDREELEDGEGL